MLFKPQPKFRRPLPDEAAATPWFSLADWGDTLKTFQRLFAADPRLAGTALAALLLTLVDVFTTGGMYVFTFWESLQSTLNAASQKWISLSEVGWQQPQPVHRVRYDALGISQNLWQSILGDRRPVIIAIHGTSDAENEDFGETLWWHTDSTFQKHVASRIPPQSAHWLPLHWNGENSAVDRDAAAHALAQLCGALSAEGIDYALLGHSHAGNIIDVAIGKYGHDCGGPERCKAILSFGTPYFSKVPTLSKRISTLATAILAVGAPLIALYAGVKYANLVNLQGYSGLLVPLAIFAVLAVLYVYLLATRSSQGRKWKARTKDIWVAYTSPRDEVISALGMIGRSDGSAAHAVPGQADPLSKIINIKYQSLERMFLNLGASAGRFIGMPLSLLLALQIVLSSFAGTMIGGLEGALPLDAWSHAVTHWVFPFAPMLHWALTEGACNVGLRPCPADMVVYARAWVWFWPFLLYFLCYGTGIGLALIVNTLRLTRGVTAAINGFVRGVARSTAYGGDAPDVKLTGIRRTPVYCHGWERAKNDLAPVRPDGSEVSELMQIFYSQITQGRIVFDPTDILNKKLNAILYHNVYFKDFSDYGLGDEVAARLNASLLSAQVARQLPFSYRQMSHGSITFGR